MLEKMKLWLTKPLHAAIAGIYRGAFHRIGDPGLVAVAGAMVRCLALRPAARMPSRITSV